MNRKPGQLPLLKPMLAAPGEPFDSPEYLYEVKWDGIRCLAYLNRETLLYSRNGNDITYRYPELVGLHQGFSGAPLILDGEIIAFEGDRPSFHRLLARDRLQNNLRILRAAAEYPAVLIVFDILYLEGNSLLEKPLHHRKEVLKSLFPAHPSLRLNDYITGDGMTYYQAICDLGLEGMIAKQANSPYLPGKRSHCWLKVKRILEEDLIICGYTKGKGHRAGLGSLILGGYQGGRLIYAGVVGSGFSNQETEELQDLLEGLRTEKVPFDRIPAINQPEWVTPQLVCSVKYLERLNSGELRHGSFTRLRSDKVPAECRLS